MKKIKSFVLIPEEPTCAERTDAALNNFVKELRARGIWDIDLDINSTSKAIVYTLQWKEK